MTDSGSYRYIRIYWSQDDNAFLAEVTIEEEGRKIHFALGSVGESDE